MRAIGDRTRRETYLPSFDEITRSKTDISDGERFFSYHREHDIQSIYLQCFFLEKLERAVDVKTTSHWDPRNIARLQKGYGRVWQPTKTGP